MHPEVDNNESILRDFLSKIGISVCVFKKICVRLFRGNAHQQFLGGVSSIHAHLRSTPKPGG